MKPHGLAPWGLRPVELEPVALATTGGDPDAKEEPEEPEEE